MKRRLNNRRRQGAFTLIEAMVAMTILSVGIFGIIAALHAARRSTADSARDARAAELAESRISAALTATSDESVALSGQSGQFQWQMSLEDLDGGLARATVVVRWLDHGAQRTYQLGRIYRRPSQ